MSPEQARGGNWISAPTCSPLGRSCTRWLPAQLPFRGATTTDLFDSILHKAPVPPVRLNPDLPARRWNDIINKSLEKDRELRYQHAADMRADLKRLKRETGSSRRRSSHCRRRRKPSISRNRRASSAPPSERQRQTSGKRETVAISAPGRRRRGLHLGRFCAGCGGRVALVAGGLYWRSRSKTQDNKRPAPLSEKDTIVLADFTNTTGDPVFDDALKQALGVQLGQSPFLNILSDRKVEEKLCI